MRTILKLLKNYVKEALEHFINWKKTTHPLAVKCIKNAKILNKVVSSE